MKVKQSHLWHPYLRKWLILKFGPLKGNNFGLILCCKHETSVLPNISKTDFLVSKTCLHQSRNQFDYIIYCHVLAVTFTVQVSTWCIVGTGDSGSAPHSSQCFACFRYKKVYTHRFNVNEDVTLQAGKGENHLGKIW